MSKKPSKQAEKEWDALTHEEQKAFMTEHVDEIFKCSVHGNEYNSLENQIKCAECRGIARSRYGEWEIE